MRPSSLRPVLRSAAARSRHWLALSVVAPARFRATAAAAAVARAARMRRSAMQRAALYEAEPIMNRFMQDLGLGDALYDASGMAGTDGDIKFDDAFAPERSVA